MKWKKQVLEYLSFTRRDRIAILSLLMLITASFLLPEWVSQGNREHPSQADTVWIAAIERIKGNDSMQSRRYAEDNNPLSYQYDRPITGKTRNNRSELFYFDPNTLPADGWQRLGLRDKTIATIQNFLSKGGRFRKPEDLSRIYGLFPDEYERIEPYIRIEEQVQAAPYISSTTKDSSRYKRNSFQGKNLTLDINTADTSAWIALPGIGSKLATRIVNFREKLGGFYSISQVAETFGLADSTFQKIKQWLKLETTSVRKISINTSTLDELKSHPYIRYAIANAIVAYRNEHGPFTSLDDLKKIMAITVEAYNRLLPYLSIN